MARTDISSVGSLVKSSGFAFKTGYTGYPGVCIFPSLSAEVKTALQSYAQNCSTEYNLSDIGDSVYACMTEVDLYRNKHGVARGLQPPSFFGHEQAFVPALCQLNVAGFMDRLSLSMSAFNGCNSTTSTYATFRRGMHNSYCSDEELLKFPSFALGLWAEAASHTLVSGSNVDSSTYDSTTGTTTVVKSVITPARTAFVSERSAATSGTEVLVIAPGVEGARVLRLVASAEILGLTGVIIEYAQSATSYGTNSGHVWKVTVICDDYYGVAAANWAARLGSSSASAFASDRTTYASLLGSAAPRHDREYIAGYVVGQPQWCYGWALLGEFADASDGLTASATDVRLVSVYDADALNTLFSSEDKAFTGKLVSSCFLLNDISRVVKSSDFDDCAYTAAMEEAGISLDEINFCEEFTDDAGNVVPAQTCTAAKARALGASLAITHFLQMKVESVSEAVVSVYSEEQSTTADAVIGGYQCYVSNSESKDVVSLLCGGASLVNNTDADTDVLMTTLTGYGAIAMASLGGTLGDVSIDESWSCGTCAADPRNVDSRLRGVYLMHQFSRNRTHLHSLTLSSISNARRWLKEVGLVTYLLS